MLTILPHPLQCLQEEVSVELVLARRSYKTMVALKLHLHLLLVAVYLATVAVIKKILQLNQMPGLAPVGQTHL
jgi:hypothetical protein